MAAYCLIQLLQDSVLAVVFFHWEAKLRVQLRVRFPIRQL